ncbi:hypothetical protein ACIBL6_22990 [Streptomyces sp. NPDC050400]|uniref:hypothetical protein n=1 Tax=Streptomyces sp. NPDC050400 TaxID=3365610 RepID=UPI0037A1687A
MKATVFPDPKRLSGDQLRGWACALCGARLYRDRPLGLVSDPLNGEYLELWACAPRCSGRRTR